MIEAATLCNRWISDRQVPPPLFPPPPLLLLIILLFYRKTGPLVINWKCDLTDTGWFHKP